MNIFCSNWLISPRMVLYGHAQLHFSFIVLITWTLVKTQVLYCRSQKAFKSSHGHNNVPLLYIYPYLLGLPRNAVNFYNETHSGPGRVGHQSSNELSMQKSLQERPVSLYCRHRPILNVKWQARGAFHPLKHEHSGACKQFTEISDYPVEHDVIYYTQTCLH